MARPPHIAQVNMNGIKIEIQSTNTLNACLHYTMTRSCVMLSTIEHWMAVDQASDYSSGDNTSSGKDISVTGTNKRLEERWEVMQRANESMLKELAHLRAMVECQSQLYSGTAPGASGSGSHTSASNPLEVVSIAVEEPAWNNTPLHPSPPAVPPPVGQQPGKFVPLPKSKAKKNIKDIQKDAGLENNKSCWLEISNIICNLMIRVNLDYHNLWLRQDKGKLGILYSLILKKAPELGVFQNGWGLEWLANSVQRYKSTPPREEGLVSHTSCTRGSGAQCLGDPGSLSFWYNTQQQAAAAAAAAKAQTNTAIEEKQKHKRKGSKVKKGRKHWRKRQLTKDEY
ncbi:hypothetical protein B0J17DRAFT_633097 [Rhizoctonia solani]|nr:hypothetical protein B0J17DRAFT_633097 [Rhizoctonia solani]